MTQSIVFGANFWVSTDQFMGDFNSHSIGDQITLVLTASGSMDTNIMFLVNGTKSYNDIKVPSGATGVSVTVPAGTTYVEFNIQSVTLTAPGALRVEMWQNT